MQSLKPHHYSKLASVPTFRLIQLSLKAYPFRLDKALVINLHPILEKAINICLAPVPEKIRSRVSESKVFFSFPHCHSHHDCFRHIADTYFKQ